jgi:4-amino-4-deoxychorismate lyase
VEGPLCRADLKLIETMRWDGQRIVRIDRHLRRLSRSALELGFPFDRARVAAALGRLAGPEVLRVRLTLGMAGEVAVTAAPLAPAAPLWRIAVASERLRSDDPWLRHKTTARARYETARRLLPPGIDEILFLNERGEICEGTITNVFADIGGSLVTPPLASGLLPGILREELLETGQCSEAVLRLPDLRDARVRVGNSLRGLLPAEWAAGGS